MSIERARDMVVDVDAVDVDAADAAVTAAAPAVLALVGLDPLALLCTPDVVLGGHQQ